MPAAHSVECNGKHKSNCSQSEIRDKINQTKYAAEKIPKIRVSREIWQKKNTKINTMIEKSTKIIQCCNLKAKELVEIAHTPRVVTVLNRCCCKKSIAYFAAALSNFNLPLSDTFYSLHFSLLCSFLPFLLLLLIPSFVAVLRC